MIIFTYLNKKNLKYPVDTTASLKSSSSSNYVTNMGLSLNGLITDTYIWYLSFLNISLLSLN